jgi:hypothetical protein
MSKSTPAPLTLPKKGEATPAITSFEEQQHSSPKVASSASRLASRVQPTIAVTVRLDESRYERMKTWGTVRRVTNQEVIVAALDRFFATTMTDEEREDAISRVRK